MKGVHDQGKNPPEAVPSSPWQDLLVLPASYKQRLLHFQEELRVETWKPTGLLLTTEKERQRAGVHIQVPLAFVRAFWGISLSDEWLFYFFMSDTLSTY